MIFHGRVNVKMAQTFSRKVFKKMAVLFDVRRLYFLNIHKKYPKIYANRNITSKKMSYQNENIIPDNKH